MSKSLREELAGFAPTFKGKWCRAYVGGGDDVIYVEATDGELLEFNAKDFQHVLYAPDRIRKMVEGRLELHQACERADPIIRHGTWSCSGSDPTPYVIWSFNQNTYSFKHTATGSVKVVRNKDGWSLNAEIDIKESGTLESILAAMPQDVFEQATKVLVRKP